MFAFGEAEHPTAVAVAQRLRAAGHSVELVLGHPKPKRALADADRSGAARVWLLGPDEVAKGRVRLKELATGHQRDVALGDEVVATADPRR